MVWNTGARMMAHAAEDGTTIHGRSRPASAQTPTRRALHRHAGPSPHGVKRAIRNDGTLFTSVKDPQM